MALEDKLDVLPEETLGTEELVTVKSSNLKRNLFLGSVAAVVLTAGGLLVYNLVGSSNPNYSNYSFSDLSMSREVKGNNWEYKDKKEKAKCPITIGGRCYKSSN